MLFVYSRRHGPAGAQCALVGVIQFSEMLWQYHLYLIFKLYFYYRQMSLLKLHPSLFVLGRKNSISQCAVKMKNKRKMTVLIKTIFALGVHFFSVAKNYRPNSSTTNKLHNNSNSSKFHRRHKQMLVAVAPLINPQTHAHQFG